MLAKNVVVEGGVNVDERTGCHNRPFPSSEAGRANLKTALMQSFVTSSTSTRFTLPSHRGATKAQ
jgi:hypothetical protein